MFFTQMVAETNKNILLLLPLKAWLASFFKQVPKYFYVKLLKKHLLTDMKPFFIVKKVKLPKNFLKMN